MARINILLVENIVDNANVFLEHLHFDLKDLDILAEWKHVRNATSARKAVRDAADAGESIDVAIVDLCLTEDSATPDGASVLRDMQKFHKDAYVLLYTGMLVNNPGFKDDYGHLSSHAITRSEISESSRWSWRNIAQDIKTHLINAGRLSAGRTSYDHEDVGIISVLEEVGDAVPMPNRYEEGARILRLLALQCLGDLVHQNCNLKIEFLAAGRSGANVCRLDFSGGGEPPQSFVLKFGFDRGALEQERAKNRDAGKVLGQSSLMAIVGEIGSHNSRYHAIMANFAANVSSPAIPLKKWLTGGATAEEAEKMAKIILLEQLEPLFHPDGISEAGVDDWVSFRPGRRLRALSVIQRYESVLSDSRTGDLRDSAELIRRLSDFVHGDRKIAGSVSSIRKVLKVRSFGDLHSNMADMKQNPQLAPDILPGQRPTGVVRVVDLV